MKKLYLTLTFLTTFFVWNAQAQMEWDTDPVNLDLECSDDDNNDDIENYLMGLEGSFNGCGIDAIITWDYTDPGNFEDADIISIEIFAEDACNLGTIESFFIDVEIEDNIEPMIDDEAEPETVECDIPNNAALLANWVADHAGATFTDDCSDPADFTWFTNPDPVDIADIVLDCGGDITVEFWVEDAAGNSSAPTSATFTLEDTTDPSFDDGAGVWDETFECDGTGNLTDVTNWVDGIMAGIAVSDNCMDAADVLLTLGNDWDGSGFSDCDGPDIEVEFEIEDECGNTNTYTAIASLEDTQDPIVTTDATDLMLACNPATNGDDIDNWIDLVGNAVFNDDCTPIGDLTITSTYSGNVPNCADGDTETVTFTIEDECGNTVETTADIIVEDIDLPIIVNIETSPATIECVSETITGEGFEDLINGIIDSAIAEDVNDCTEPDDLIWVVTPDPATPPNGADVPDPDCPGGVFTGQYIFDVIVEDECGNQSAMETITITVEDTTDPLDPTTLPGDESVECEADIPAGTDLFPPDDCESPPAVMVETIVEDECPMVIERMWVFEDFCGNESGDHTQTITVEDDDAPEWIGDEDDYLPDDIDIVVASCDAPYTFPNGYFENEAEGDEWPIFPPAEGSEFEDACMATFMTIGPPPTEEFGEGATTITYIITDDCGNSATHEFTVNIICSNCEGGGVACLESCGTVEDGCHTCNIDELLDGFESCTPEFLGQVLDWPPSLCNGQGVPHNMSWFSFVAGGADLCVTVSPNMCAMGTGAIGLQSGVYDFCEDDDGVCVGGEAACSSGLDEISYGLSDLIVGNTYYLFVDGCNGAECDYEIEVEKGFEFVIDTPEEVVVEASCEQVPGFPPLQYCPQTILQFDIWHAGDSPSDGGDYDDAGPYNPDLVAEYYWTFDPPIEGMTDGVWETGEEGDGFNIPPLSFPDVAVPTTYTICLEEIIAECSDAECEGDGCCLEVVIAPIPDEMYGPYEVCVEDLLEATGWDPANVGEDPNGDGIEWMGADNITLEQVNDAEENGISILTYDVFDPDCGCMFQQSVQIIPIGNLEPVEMTLYMFDCQFRDEDGDLESYIWEWPNDDYELTVDMEDFFFRIFEGSIERDWENERCDSLLLITVDTAIVEGKLTQGPCTPTGTEYCFELLIDLLEDNHDEHPTINPDYFGMHWVDANTGLTASEGPCFSVTPATSGQYFVEVEYSFIDGAYDPALAVVGECAKVFGPFELDSGTALPPTVVGEDSFCVNDLTGKLFNVDGPIDGYVYEWTFPTGVSGNLLNAPANDMAEIDFTNYDFNANEPILIVANTPCGISEAYELYVSTVDLPVPTFTVVSPVCVGDLAEANFTGDQSMVSEYIWSTDNYNSGNQSSAGPVNYSTSAPGFYDVTLITVNLEGCESEPVTQQFEVIAPLEAPVIDCSETASSVGFSWDAITGATGYIITVLQHPDALVQGSVLNNLDTELSVDFPGLSVNSIVEVSVIATGGAPCFNGPSASLECQAQDCPEPQWIFNVWADTSFCVNAPIDAYTFDVSGPDGTTAYSSTVPGVVTSDGTIDPTAFPVGETTITMTYTYQNGDCDRNRSIVVEVYDQPQATFVPSALELCLGESITIDDTNVDNVATWDYGVDGSIDANGDISWTSSGPKTISVSVTTPAIDGSCTNASMVDVMVLDTLIFGEITCIDQDLNFVEFDWDDVVGATGYDISYTINGELPATETSITDSGIRIEPLMPDDEVVITVTALSPNQCNDVTRTADCVAVSCVPLIFDNPVCAEEGIDYVLFEWDPVIGASMYEITINGNLIGIQDSLTYFVDGLSPGDIVSISVTAINDLDNCADVTRTRDCTAGDCPEATFTFTPVDEPCYNAAVGGIQLVDPTIDGVVGNGTGNWNSPFVDASGVFTPDPEQDMIYMLEYEYVEGTCNYSEELEVEIIIIPEGELDVSDDDICITETTMIEVSSEFGNNETAIWDFGTGVNAVGSDFGPYELTFDAPGTYEISVVLDNEGCLSEPIVTTIEVDAELITPNITCSSSNSFINFNWDDVADVNQYSISIDGVFQTTQTNSDFRVDGLNEGDIVEITIGFLSDSSCALEDLVFECETTACPPSFFNLSAFDNMMCLDGTEENVQLDITLENAPSDPGTGAWSGQGVSANGLFNPTGLSGNIELTYSIEFELCSYDTSINITLFEAPQITAINPVNPDCYGDQPQLGGISPEVSGGTAPYTYTVGNLPAQDFPAFIDVLQPGQYDLEVTDANGCTARQAIDIIAAIEPNIAIDGPSSILIGEFADYVLITDAPNIGMVTWTVDGVVICDTPDCDLITILTENYPEGTEFVDVAVQVIFNDDCFIETEIRVNFFELQKYYIPNIISKGADTEENQNWAMFIKGNRIVVNSVKVYDRWGELVHDQVLGITQETAGLNGKVDLSWNGTWTDGSNAEVVPGVYVYMIDMEVDGRKVIEAGDITVLR